MSKPQQVAGGASRNLFGAFGGVFTPCTLTILGVIMFMRANFVIGEAGILGAIAILVIAKSITVLTALSASAISTNMQVRGGGAYFLISRVLGPEFGGAIGIVLFLAQAVSAPFYVLGFTEALVQTMPALAPHYAAIAFGTAGVLFVVAYIGAGWAIKVQYGIMAVLAVSIVAFLGGALTRFSPETFSTNWLSGYTLLSADNPDGGGYSFWIVFAIYFPAVTGIMAGINMSGDLEEPARAIPRGILGAVGVGFVIYLAQILISGGAFDRADLLERPYLVLKEHALFGAGFVVAAGMFAATLSSALGSFLGAPRVLQAVGRDRILAPLQTFATGAPKGDEPRRAMLATGAITAGVLLWAVTGKGNALDLVAGAITMFFLYTYGMLNVAAFLEAVTDNPSFRPRFRFFHWSTALAGGLGCAAVAFVIDPRQAAVAVVLLALMVWYIKAQELRVAFGDAWRGLAYKAARNSLLRLSKMKEDPKNWRPTTLVFSGNPESHETLVTYGVWLEGGRGIVFLASILVGRFEDCAPRRGAAVQQLKEFCRKRDIHAFPVVVISEELAQGVASVLQATSVGPIRPNLVMLGWSATVEQGVAAIAQLRVARAMDMGLVVVRPGGNPLIGTCRRIDIWWRGRRNGSLMVLLGHLLTRNWEWSRASVRLLRFESNEAAREGMLSDLEDLLRVARVDATAHVVISGLPFETVLREESEGADCVFLGFEVPKEEDAAVWYRRHEYRLEGMPTTILVCATGEEDATA